MVTKTKPITRPQTRPEVQPSPEPIFAPKRWCPNQIERQAP